MIVPYYGEFLTSPAPLELSLNWCSHACAYCFANLNSPTRTGDVKATMSLLGRFKDADTLEAQLLQRGYPTVISNKVDPFSASNDKQMIPIIRAMQGMGLPVVIQTKGGKHAKEIADWLHPSVWYITVETDDDKLSKQIAPGAPTTSERLDLIRHLVNRGHRVVVGMNPSVEGWITNPQRHIQSLKDAGAEGIWSEALHLSRDQIKNMTERQKATIPEKTMVNIQAKGGPTPEFVDSIRQEVKDQGVPLYYMANGEHSEFFKPYYETYEHTYPNMQGFINTLHEVQTPDEDLILDWEDYRDWFLPQFPQDLTRCRLGHYLSSRTRAIAKDPKYSNWLDWESVLKMAYAHPRSIDTPDKYGAIYRLLDDNDRPEFQNGLPRFIFNPS